MRTIIFAAICLLFVPFAAQAEEAPSPFAAEFANYPIGVHTAKKRVAPKIKGTDLWEFRTRIRDGAKQPINFAGHYVLIEWGCGTECQVLVLYDTVTGKVIPVGPTSYGFDSRQNSNLLILNPVEDGELDYVPDYLVREYLLFDGKEFHKIREEKPIAAWELEVEEEP